MFGRMAVGLRWSDNGFSSIEYDVGKPVGIYKGQTAVQSMNRDVQSTWIEGDNLAPAERYSTRGTEPVGEILVDAAPFDVPVGVPLNAHIVWGLYRSVIAYNMPDNVRETRATIMVHGLYMAKIDYTLFPQAPTVAKKESQNVNTALTSELALQMLSSVGHRLRGNADNPRGYSLRFILVGGGAAIRRETAYDAIAYAMGG